MCGDSAGMQTPGICASRGLLMLECSWRKLALSGLPVGRSNQELRCSDFGLRLKSSTARRGYEKQAHIRNQQCFEHTEHCRGKVGVREEEIGVLV